MAGTPRSETISTKRTRIAKLARQMPGTALTSLSHHIDLDWMYEAYRQTRKDGARGVDGQGSEEFAQDLEGNLAELLNRAKSGRYRAPAVRRVYIPKDGGRKTRPIGIPTFGDKVLQRAVKMVLEPVYEQDFLDCSYGFRPGRSQHQALQALWTGLMDMKGGWVLDLDIQNFFGELDHRELQRLLRQRVTDGITGNGEALGVFKYFVERIWRKWLSRRSRRSRMSWERFRLLLRRYPLPSPVVVHSIYRRSANP